MAAAALLWDALLTTQRRQSFFYGELAGIHPLSGGATMDNNTVSMAPADAVNPVAEMEPALQEARSPTRVCCTPGRTQQQWWL